MFNSCLLDVAVFTRCRCGILNEHPWLILRKVKRWTINGPSTKLSNQKMLKKHGDVHKTFHTYSSELQVSDLFVHCSVQFLQEENKLSRIKLVPLENLSAKMTSTLEA